MNTILILAALLVSLDLIDAAKCVLCPRTDAWGEQLARGYWVPRQDYGICEYPAVGPDAGCPYSEGGESLGRIPFPRECQSFICFRSEDDETRQCPATAQAFEGSPSNMNGAVLICNVTGRRAACTDFKFKVDQFCTYLDQVNSVLGLVCPGISFAKDGRVSRLIFYLNYVSEKASDVAAGKPSNLYSLDEFKDDFLLFRGAFLAFLKDYAKAQLKGSPITLPTAIASPWLKLYCPIVDGIGVAASACKVYRDVALDCEKLPERRGINTGMAYPPRLKEPRSKTPTHPTIRKRSDNPCDDFVENIDPQYCSWERPSCEFTVNTVTGFVSDISRSAAREMVDACLATQVFVEEMQLLCKAREAISHVAPYCAPGGPLAGVFLFPDEAPEGGPSSSSQSTSSSTSSSSVPSSVPSSAIPISPSSAFSTASAAVSSSMVSSASMAPSGASSVIVSSTSSSQSRPSVFPSDSSAPSSAAASASSSIMSGSGSASSVTSSSVSTAAPSSVSSRESSLSSTSPSFTSVSASTSSTLSSSSQSVFPLSSIESSASSSSSSSSLVSSSALLPSWQVSSSAISSAPSASASSEPSHPSPPSIASSYASSSAAPSPLAPSSSTLSSEAISSISTSSAVNGTPLSISSTSPASSSSPAISSSATLPPASLSAAHTTASPTAALVGVACDGGKWIQGDSPDTPDTPDSPDGQPEMPEIPEILDQNGSYFACTTTTTKGNSPTSSKYISVENTPASRLETPSPVQSPSVQATSRLIPAIPSSSSSPPPAKATGPNGCTWQWVYGDSPDTPDTPDSPDGLPEIPEQSEIPNNGPYWWGCV